MFKIRVFLLLGICLGKSIADSTPDEFTFEKENLSIRVHKLNDNTLYYTVERLGFVVQKFRLTNEESDESFSYSDTETGFVLSALNQNIQFEVLENEEVFSLVKVSRRLNVTQRVGDCVELGTGHVNWFGGPQIDHQHWPVEKLHLRDYSYVTKQQDNVGVAERYWFNSKGFFIYIDDKVPLFLNQNVERNTLCFDVDNKLPYNTRRTSIDFNYHIGVAHNAKAVHMKAVERFLKKPTGLPDRLMVQYPIWSTWARYKSNINEKTVEEFVSDIEKYGFPNSQFEIDDDWEVCYGALTFRETKFPDIKKLTDNLRSRGFRVTLWIHPFINKGCEPWYSEAKNKGYLVVDHNNNTDTEWWNSKKDEASYVDFTNPEAAQWFADRLKKLQADAGIDSYKFDAGETSWSPKDPKYFKGTPEEHPSIITKAYIRTVAQFGPIVEVRAAQGTQDLPIFLRMLDKDTYWTFRNGLPTLITTLLQLNLVGYNFILPDVIGGNGYDTKVTKELFIRWLQANVFMPSLQYSYVPWEYDDETIELSKQFTKLHADHTDVIMNAMQAAVDRGEPVNKPIWWLDPHDQIALGIDDESLLGDCILAAPIIHEAIDQRHVYLPRGKWRDGNTNETYHGPRWLMEYPAPLNFLPYFIKDGPHC